MKRLYLMTLCVLVSAFLFAQNEEPEEKKATNWKTGGVVSVNASQTAFSNWAAGGENSYGLNSFLNLHANYKKEKTNWDNTLDLGFGMMKQGQTGKVYKTDDKIDFASKYGLLASEHWFYSALFSFKSQFYEGKKSITDTTKISNFLSPGYLNLSIGMDLKYNGKLTIYLSPVSSKVTIVTDPHLNSIGAFGVSPGDKFRIEIGGLLKAQYNVKFKGNIDYITKLELFSNYLEKPQNIDVNWENRLNFKINNFFSANIYITMIYDDDARIKIQQEDGSIKECPKLQFREISGLGLTYKF